MQATTTCYLCCLASNSAKFSCRRADRIGDQSIEFKSSRASGTHTHASRHSEDNLITEKTEKFRSLAGRLLYHSLDDPRVQLETGLVMRGMSTTRVLDEARLHRAVRYIAGTPGVDWLFRWQGGAETSKLYGLADADHAADDESRRSVSCSQEFLGCHLLDQEVGRQTCVPMSSEKKRVPRFDLLCETHLHEESG